MHQRSKTCSVSLKIHSLNSQTIHLKIQSL